MKNILYLILFIWLVFRVYINYIREFDILIIMIFFLILYNYFSDDNNIKNSLS